MKKIFLFGISAMMACSLSFSALAAPAAVVNSLLNISNIY